MNSEINNTVTLILETGQKFEEVPVQTEDVPLAEFLDKVLKALEVTSVCLQPPR